MRQNYQNMRKNCALNSIKNSMFSQTENKIIVSPRQNSFYVDFVDPFSLKLLRTKKCSYLLS